MVNTEQFDEFISSLPGLLHRLESGPVMTVSALGTVPSRGIYVFYEAESPLYVGRSRRLKARLREHGQQSSDRYSATFAFRLAQEKGELEGIDCKSVKKAELAQNTRFVPLFVEAKARVAAMTIQVVEVEDPVEQTIFEVYAALALHTQYNDFETH